MRLPQLGLPNGAWRLPPALCLPPSLPAAPTFFFADDSAKDLTVAHDTFDFMDSCVMCTQSTRSSGAHAAAGPSQLNDRAYIPTRTRE